jgi:hypothetical protein
MSEAQVNFIQKIEDVDEILLIEENAYCIDEDISVWIGRDSKKLYGIKIVKGNTKRDIWFSDIDRIGQIIDKMQGR